MKMLYVAPYGDFSGYADAARNYIAALHSVGCDLVLRKFTYDGGQYTNELLTTLESKSAQGVNIVIQNTTPNEMQRKEGVFNVAVFCWETDRIPSVWVDKLNSMDLVLVPFDGNVLAAKLSGVIKPIEKVHYACDVERYKNKPASFQLPEYANHFKFLSICQYAKKKGVDPLLKAYLSEFGGDEKVLLVLKTYFGPKDGQQEYQAMAGIIGHIKKAMRLKSYPPLRLIHGVMCHGDIDRLYSTCDAYCLPSRGEGWGVPHFDGLGFGLPTIATKGTGPEEFIQHGHNGYLVSSHWSPVVDMNHPFDYLYTAEENWREPQVDSLRKYMRDLFEMHKVRNQSPKWNDMCAAGRKRIEDFSHEKIGHDLKVVIEKYYKEWAVK